MSLSSTECTEFPTRLLALVTPYLFNTTILAEAIKWINITPFIELNS